jgi:flagellar L-ring protein precursor FlgH
MNKRATIVLLVLSFCIVQLSAAGCTSFGVKVKKFLAGDSASQKPVMKSKSRARYSSRKNIPYRGKGRNYVRMTKQKFEERARIQENAGSLWVNEGQNSYLFTQNLVRQLGDIIRVELDGQPKQQLATKVTVLKKLLLRHRKAKRRMPASRKATAVKGKAAAVDEKKEDAQAAKKKAQEAKKQKEEENEVKNATFAVQKVPARITERLGDGSYRVRGKSSFMIGRREYRVIVSGLVKAGDIADDSVSASKMIDANFDIVSLKREVKL